MLVWGKQVKRFQLEEDFMRCISGALAATVLILSGTHVAAQQPAAGNYPPPWPRPGTTGMLDNEAFAVWNVSWLQQQYPLHTHRYDLIGISYTTGDRIITQGNQPGRPSTTRPWVFQTNRAGVTHVEEGASDPPLRAVLIEVKSPAPRPETTTPPPADALTVVGGPPAWQNNRALGWMVLPGTDFPAHRHIGDALELVFDGSDPPVPTATFVPAGTMHSAPIPPADGRVVIFELK